MGHPLSQRGAMERLSNMARSILSRENLLSQALAGENGGRSFRLPTLRTSATDANGNTASESFTVTVRDTTAPTLTPVADQTDQAPTSAGAVALFAATASDIVNGTVPVVFKEANTVVHSGVTFALGTHSITASATDAHGNAASENFTINVIPDPFAVSNRPITSDVALSTTASAAYTGCVLTAFGKLSSSSSKSLHGFWH